MFVVFIIFFTNDKPLPVIDMMRDFSMMPICSILSEYRIYFCHALLCWLSIGPIVVTALGFDHLRLHGCLSFTSKWLCNSEVHTYTVKEVSPYIGGSYDYDYFEPL